MAKMSSDDGPEKENMTFKEMSSSSKKPYFCGDLRRIRRIAMFFCFLYGSFVNLNVTWEFNLDLRISA